MIIDNLEKILECLENNCKIKSSDADDADTRKYAILAYEEVVNKLISNMDNFDDTVLSRFF